MKILNLSKIPLSPMYSAPGLFEDEIYLSNVHFCAASSITGGSLFNKQFCYLNKTHTLACNRENIQSAFAALSKIIFKLDSESLLMLYYIK